MLHKGHPTKIYSFKSPKPQTSASAAPTRDTIGDESSEKIHPEPVSDDNRQTYLHNSVFFLFAIFFSNNARSLQRNTILHSAASASPSASAPKTMDSVCFRKLQLGKNVAELDDLRFKIEAFSTSSV